MHQRDWSYRERHVKKPLFKRYREVKIVFYSKNNQWAPCVFLCILPEPAHFTSDKSPWQYLVLSEKDANIHILTNSEISFLSLLSSYAIASLFTFIMPDILLPRMPGVGE